MTFGRLLPHLAIPVAVLAGAWLLVPALSDLPPSLSGLRIYGAYGVLALGAVVSLPFRRGRVLLALALLALAYASYGLLAHDALASFRARTVFAALAVFVPLNFAALSLLQERGVFSVFGMQRVAAIALETAFTLWVVFAIRIDIIACVYAPLLDAQFFPASPIPQLGLVAIALSFAACFATWIVKRTPIELGFTGAVAAFGIALNGVAAPYVFPAFVAAGGLILTIAVLQDTFRMAFRDELTGLPSRRDLNESLMGLGRRYAIGMIDVDHFKNFNDTHGHDLGDQVLKMVAIKLADVGGGGKAYRYGGEEFTVLFPGKDLSHALPHLEALRKDVADYKLALRAPDRPDDPKSASRQRGAFRAAKSVSVTISIGVAERNDRLVTPTDVMLAADKALYRAKDKGRNRVSR